MKDLWGKTVLVTGAASGIGRETALAFGRRGCRVLLVDIDGPGLEETARDLKGLGISCRTYRADVSDSTQVALMVERTLGEFGPPDVLVNVAGVCMVADIVDTPMQDWEWIIGVNLLGPIHVISAFLPSMIARKSGHIVNVASGGGLFALAGIGAYCTSKFALVGLGEALEQEVRQHNIKVTTVCPGGTSTPIVEHTRFRGYSPERAARRAGFVVSRCMPASRLAGIIVEAVEKERHLVTTTAFVKVMYFTRRLSPALFRLSTRFGRRALLPLLR